MAHYMRSLVGRNIRKTRSSLWRNQQQEQQQHGSLWRAAGIRSASSASSENKLEDPSKLVAGLTLEEVEANPEISDFMQSNFGDEASSGDEDITSGISIPAEVLREFGIDDDELIVGILHVSSGTKRPSPFDVRVGDLGASWFLKENYHIKTAVLVGPKGREQRLAAWFDFDASLLV